MVFSKKGYGSGFVSKTKRQSAFAKAAASTPAPTAYGYGSAGTFDAAARANRFGLIDVRLPAGDEALGHGGRRAGARPRRVLARPLVRPRQRRAPRVARRPALRRRPRREAAERRARRRAREAGDVWRPARAGQAARRRQDVGRERGAERRGARVEEPADAGARGVRPAARPPRRAAAHFDQLPGTSAFRDRTAGSGGIFHDNPAAGARRSAEQRLGVVADDAMSSARSRRVQLGHHVVLRALPPLAAVLRLALDRFGRALPGASRKPRGADNYPGPGRRTTSRRASRPISSSAFMSPTPTI